RRADAVPDRLDDVVVQPPEHGREDPGNDLLDCVEDRPDDAPGDLNLKLNRDPDDFDQVPEDDERDTQNALHDLRDRVENGPDDAPRLLDCAPDERERRTRLLPQPLQRRKIGRASCRERGQPSAVGGSLKRNRTAPGPGSYLY